jgi:hypothetical protein
MDLYKLGSLVYANHTRRNECFTVGVIIITSKSSLRTQNTVKNYLYKARLDSKNVKNHYKINNTCECSYDGNTGDYSIERGEVTNEFLNSAQC